MSERTEWKVRAVLDKKAILTDIAHLVRLLRMPKLYCVVSAESQAQAISEAQHHMEVVMQVPKKYLERLTPRRLK